MPTDTEPSALMHFCAQTPHGTLHLQLPARHGGDAVGAALALADAQPLLGALEQWLALTLDPAPGLEPADPPPGLLWCSTVDNVHLGLPWQLLAQAPPSGMPVLHGPELALQVVVARWPQLPPLPQAAGGGLLLLPASFADGWRVTLVQPELGFEIDALWAGPGHAPTLAGAPHAALGSAATVRLVQSLQWPMAAVLGWCQAPDTALSDQAQFWQQAAAGVAQARVSGCIVPALGGAGLLVAATPLPSAALPAVAVAASSAATVSA
jgi:hypothetical protein